MFCMVETAGRTWPALLQTSEEVPFSRGCDVRSFIAFSPPRNAALLGVSLKTEMNKAW